MQMEIKEERLKEQGSRTYHLDKNLHHNKTNFYQLF